MVATSMRYSAEVSAIITPMNAAENNRLSPAELRLSHIECACRMPLPRIAREDIVAWAGYSLINSS
jgi:hypothetical protein